MANPINVTTSAAPSFASTSGGAGYGTVGLGRVNLGFNPLDFNSFAASYQMSPAAQYQMGIGDAAVNNSAAAKGGLLSSADLRNLMTTNQGIVSQDMFKQYGAELQGQQQDYSQRLASMGLLQSQEAMGANASNAVMSGASSSGASQASAISSGANAAAADYANMFKGFGNLNLGGSGSGGSAFTSSVG
ncbi:hypothetical protein AOQ71_31645 [Bradyrhizobium manausense]|uniref:Uncharacterized protein n=2 Tax=Bradyrhizobium manausense TaxID=989370 RepID=A0A0R3D6L9_9BRAD|nr:hypothetical protein AOQ71_31645 [Bradyrhizobium manausense]